ncbi:MULTISPECIES: ParA family protein [Actinomycetes]|uniref:ParA family protein n=1 Tax=Actinomycetes TaxID=1760 RepID=UPI001C4E9F26|nr:MULTISPECIES: ParA family protein [Actinomycetes]HRL80913.1 ParA family protein [Propioniciclava sp.]
MTAQIFALCNQKGGVGKSTTAFQLARAAVLAGRRVLAIDLDPQGNFTSNATAEPVDSAQAGIADVLSSRAPETIRDVTVPGVWPGLSVAPTPSYATLVTVRDELTITQVGREVRLKDALALVADDYDLILIDCPPSLDALTINGLTAAQGVVVVTEAKKWSLDGLSQLLATIEGVKSYYNAALRVAGIIVNRHEERTVSAQQWLADLESVAAERELPLLTPTIPKRVVISDATESSRGLDEWPTAEATALGAIYAAHLASIEGEPS